MKKKYYQQTLLQSLAFLLLSIIITTPVIFIQNLKIFPKENFLYIFFGLFIFNVFLIYFLKNRKNKELFNFNFKVNKSVLIFILLLIVFQLAINIPTNYILSNLLNYNDPKISFGMTISHIFLFIFMSSVFEEFIFRGVILKGYLYKYNFKKAIFISAILFSLVHLNPLQSLGALFFGFLSGYIYYYTRSIGMTILLHLTANIVAFIGGYLSNNYGTVEISNINSFYGKYSVYIIITSILIFFHLIYYVRKNKNNIIDKLKKLNDSKRLYS